jgi:hypothetical protein
MNPLNDDSWKCSKLLLGPNFNQRDKTYSFRLIWIRASKAMKGYIPVKGNVDTKEICRSYATEKECLEGINNLQYDTVFTILYIGLLELREEKEAEYRKLVEDQPPAPKKARTVNKSYQASEAVIIASPLQPVSKFLAYDPHWIEVKLKY